MNYDKIPLKTHRAICKLMDAVLTDPRLVEKDISVHPDWATIPEPVEEGLTLLHTAALEGSLRLCKFLHGKGVDINLETVRAGFSTPLEFAAQRGHLDVCAWLVDHGASVDGSERATTTPLMVAAQEGHIEVVQFLIKHGAEINRVHRSMPWTALDWAESYDQPATAKLLRARGATCAQIENTNWSKVYGGSIIDYFHKNAGPVLPISFSPIVLGKRPLELRLSRVEGKDHFKLLFTVGLFPFQMIELYFVLPAEWPITSSRISSEPSLAFPAQKLLDLAAEVASGHEIREGFLLRRPAAQKQNCGWPPDVDALVAVDQTWPKDTSKRDYAPEDEVTLLALVPLKATKKGLPEGKALAEWIAKNRKTSWKKHSLPTPKDL